MAVLFTNPVVAQQVQAAAQNQLAQRQLDLQDRESFLSGIRQAQEVASRERAQRYQTDAYRDASQGQNRVGMARVQADTLNTGRELDLKSVMAENDRQFRERELATRKAIAEINANATRLRPQDLVDLEQTVAAENKDADQFNTEAANAAAMLKAAIAELRQKDEEVVKAGEGMLGGVFVGGQAKSAAEAAKARLAKGVEPYYGLALKVTPDIGNFVSLQGTNVVAKQLPFIRAEGGKLVAVTPSAPQVSAMGQNLPTNNPAALIPRLGSSPFGLTNRATGRAFTARPIQ